LGVSLINVCGETGYENEYGNCEYDWHMIGLWVHEETDPAYRINPNSCLLTAQYNRVAERLMFQHDHRPWPEQLR
jgi:hypothetical protein